MSDLEPVGQSIPRIIDQAIDAADRELVRRLNDAFPPGPEPVDDDPIHVWAEHEHVLPQPDRLDARLCDIRHAIQCLDLDEALALIFDLESEVHAINRAAEPHAQRLRPAEA